MSRSQDDAFVRVKSKFVLQATLGNLHRLASAPHVWCYGQPFRGQTVTVVGAGPSLERVQHHLPELAKRGPVVCINKSGPILKSLGITPAVMLCRESLDLTDEVKATGAHVTAIDIACTGETWDAAGVSAAWFLPRYPRLAPLSMELGVRTIAAGTAALTTLVQLCREWGAERILLVGVDLGAREDGRAYHSATDRGSATLVDDRGVTILAGNGPNDERCRRSGQVPPAERTQTVRAIAQDWSGVRISQQPWEDQREWLFNFWDRNKHIECIRCDESETGVPGWTPVPLHDVIETLPEVAPVVPVPVREGVPPWRVEQAMLRRGEGVEFLEAMSRAMLAPSGPDLRWISAHSRLLEGDVLVESMAAHLIVDLPRGNSPKVRRQTWEAFGQAASMCREALGMPWVRKHCDTPGQDDHAQMVATGSMSGPYRPIG